MRANFVLSEVATGLRRNLAMTVAMIITTAISLCFFGAGLLVAKQIGEMRALYYDKLQVSIYLKDSITPQQRDALQRQLTESPEVIGTEYVTKEQAYKRFQELFQNDPNLVKQTTAADLPATFLVKLKNPERYTVISQQFTGAPGVDQVQGQSEALDRIFSGFNGIRDAAIVIALIQALASLLLISNTIQVAAFHRRIETGIMRLVGASRWYTQLPFMLEAAVAGLVGALLGVGMLVLGKVLFLDKTLGEPIRAGIIPDVDVGSILMISPWVGLTGVALASIAAYVTLRLYVRL
jgi:cell division transport system permease protein